VEIKQGEMLPPTRMALIAAWATYLPINFASASELTCRNSYAARALSVLPIGAFQSAAKLAM
jgi:hypothetical protein